MDSIAGCPTALCERTLRVKGLHFGQGDNVGQWGGRNIWQLADSRDLVFCGKTLTYKEPRAVECQMIADFKAVHVGKRPFANLKD